MVLALVVDQFSGWVAEERVPTLPADGFFARMVREGTWAKHMRYPYAITDTAPGHAALHTGLTPNETHVLVNENPDDETGLRTSYFRDPKTRVVTPAGVQREPGSSAHPLVKPTVADVLREQSPRAKIISVSLKDRAALLPAGKHPDHALWFDPDQDSFVTSTAIEPSFPAWAAPIADHAAIVRARAKPWPLLDASWVAAHASTRDDAPGEGDLLGLGTTFPHPVTTARSFRATPLSDPIILDLALAGVRAERDAQAPLLLLISLSASDLIGHTFGVHSWEAWDHLHRLDRELSRFLRELEAIAGPVSVVVSGDHGNSSMPESRVGCREEAKDGHDPSDGFYDRPCAPGHRIIPDLLRDQLRDEAAKVLGRPDVIAGVSDGYVFLSRAGRALGGSDRAKLDALVARVSREKNPDTIAAIFDARELAEKCPAALATAPRAPERARAKPELVVQVCQSWAPEAGAGDYYIVPAHGSYFDGEIVPGKGGSHGTPWLYDRTVPLFVRGPGVVAGATIDEPVDFTAYSRIERAFVGLDPTPASTLLREATAK